MNASGGSSGRFGRREFLGLAAAGALFGVTGCAPCPGSAGSPRPGTGLVPAPSAAAAFVAEGSVAEPGATTPHTVHGLLSKPNFFVAHRGSGDNWPEHTMRAYRQSADAGLKAIEVSVSATSDGVLVCHHDLTTARLTGTALTIATTPAASLAQLRNDARPWLGPATPLEPIPLLTEVLDAFAASHVIFLEDKQGTNAERILTLLKKYPDARQHIIWKQPASSAGHAQAAADGYTTWGYVTRADYPRLAELVPLVDMLGVHHTAPEDRILELVDSGKPVIAWEVRRRTEHLRLRELGVRGFICSNIRHVLHQEAPRGEDRFAEGLRGTGDLPWKADGGWEEQPGFAGEAVRLANQERAGYLLGSLAGAVDAPDWELAFELRWPDGLPPAGGSGGAGVAFGQSTDASYRRESGPGAPGYELDVGAGGRITLSRRDPGVAAAVELAAGDSPAPAPGEWLAFVVSVAPHSLTVHRLDGGAPRWSVRSEDSRYGGGWFSLLKNYDAGPAVEFRRVRVRAAAASERCTNVG